MGKPQLPPFTQRERIILGFMLLVLLLVAFIPVRASNLKLELQEDFEFNVTTNYEELLNGTLFEFKGEIKVINPTIHPQKVPFPSSCEFFIDVNFRGPAEVQRYPTYCADVIMPRIFMQGVTKMKVYQRFHFNISGLTGLVDGDYTLSPDLSGWERWIRASTVHFFIKNGTITDLSAQKMSRMPDLSLLMVIVPLNVIIAILYRKKYTRMPSEAKISEKDQIENLP